VADAPDDDHRRAVEAWRQRRYANLRRPISWLTLAGLAWLRPGKNRIGTDADADVVLPSGPSAAGAVVVADGAVTAHAAADGALRHDGLPVDGLRMTPDVDAPDDAGPTLLELGALRLCVIRRGERLAMRVWDTESPALVAFDGIPHFPVDPRWRFDARFVPPAAGATVEVSDIIGDVAAEPSAGVVRFDVDGGTYELEALEGGDAGELWLVFGDATNGHETYGGGRFLYTPAPVRDRVEVDFNRAYNPPCVFSPYATCPLPWPANRLPIRIEAGEMKLPD
jgi:uncharacterized protein